jgi:hypothetical protein
MSDPVRTWRSRLRVYAVELAVGLALASAFFLVLLWALHRFVPESTELGAFARGPRASVREAPRGPAEAPRPPSVDVAVLSVVHGDVQDRPADSIAWFVSRMGRRLGNGHAVQSYANASARVDFDDRNVIELGEKTVVVVRTPERTSPAAPRAATVLFMDGFLRARIDPRTGEAPALDIQAGGGSVRPAGARGGAPAEIALKLDRNRSTLAVLDGAAELVWKDRVTKVAAGTMVSYDPSHPPGAPVPLPATPSPLAPREGERFPFRANPPRVELTWSRVDDAPEFSRADRERRAVRPRRLHRTRARAGARPRQPRRRELLLARGGDARRDRGTAERRAALRGRPGAESPPS